MQEKTIQLRSGQALLLRQVHPEDARAMLNYLERTSAETHFMVRLPEEVTFSLEEEQALLADCLSSDRRIMLAAFAGDCIVGNVAIAPVGERYKVRHRANLGIAIVQEYCNMRKWRQERRRRIWGLRSCRSTATADLGPS